MGLSRRLLLGQALAGTLVAPGALRAATAQPAAGVAAPAGFDRFDLSAPDGRPIPVFARAPRGRARGTILFSHGAGSAPAYYPDFIAAWVASGYRVLAPLHVDSREHPRTRDFPGLASWKARIDDMVALIGHIGPAPFVAAGHSYGGLVALTLGGAEPVPPAGLSLPLFPRLARAVMAFSPPAPIPVLVTEAGYGALSVPALIQTGTKDIVPGITTNDAEGWRGHLVPFTAGAATGRRYGLVLTGVNHYFGGAICDFAQPGPPQREALAAACTISRLFLSAQVEGQKAARALLDETVGERPALQLLRR